MASIPLSCPHSDCHPLWLESSQQPPTWFCLHWFPFHSFPISHSLCDSTSSVQCSSMPHILHNKTQTPCSVTPGLPSHVPITLSRAPLNSGLLPQAAGPLPGQPFPCPPASAPSSQVHSPRNPIKHHLLKKPSQSPWLLAYFFLPPQTVNSLCSKSTFYHPTVTRQHVLSLCLLSFGAGTEGRGARAV